MIWQSRLCGFCGEEFTPNNGKQRFCSRDCQVRHHRDMVWRRKREDQP